MTHASHHHHRAQPAQTGRAGLGWMLASAAPVVLTAAGLWYAGSAPAAKAERAAFDSGHAAPATTPSCASDLPGAVRLEANQVAAGPNWLAYADCAEPRSSWWFVGAGAVSAHTSTLTLTNPRPGDAVVDVDVVGPKGTVKAPGLHGLPLKSGSTRKLALAGVAPSTGELAVHVSASRGLVAASMSEHQTIGLRGKRISEWLPAQPDPAKTQTLTGLPVKPASARLLVANPGQSAAVVSVRAIGTAGSFTPQGAASVTVAPGSVGQLDLSKAFDGKPTALAISSPAAVTATLRAFVGSDETYAAAAVPLQGAVAAGIPDKATGSVVLSAPGKTAAATVAAYDAKGKQVANRAVKVAAGTSTGVPLPAGARSVVVTTTGGGGLIGGLTLNGAGVAGAALNPPGQGQRVPGVVPGW